MKTKSSTTILMEKFPEFFVKDVSSNIPIPWMNIIQNALCVIKKSGLSMTIQGFRVETNRLVAVGVRPKDELSAIQHVGSKYPIEILNMFLKSTKNICPLCGNEKNMDNTSSFICPKCLSEYNVPDFSDKNMCINDDEDDENYVDGVPF